ncbi:MAG: nucleoside deaminase [Ilumatobacter sp.]|uniref:nucleoside deaminase n=1 Tax=Ilumatobacter sp. TaxID=1967498 RepID=UPI003919BF6E
MPWRVAFEEAWSSAAAGNYGIGAVLIDPSSQSVVATGRNRVTDNAPPVGQVGGNFLAHAEINALAAMPSSSARGFHLYSTLEPCLMCSATAIQLNVEHVHFAASDEFFGDLDDLWTHHQYTRTRRPGRTGPLDGMLARFARLLPLAFTLRTLPDSTAARVARTREPELASLADRLAPGGDLDDVWLAARVDDAIDQLGPLL